MEQSIYDLDLDIVARWDIVYENVNSMPDAEKIALIFEILRKIDERISDIEEKNSILFENDENNAPDVENTEKEKKVLVIKPEFKDKVGKITDKKR